MITICPQCQASLAVCAADLRVAHGQVRCGRCGSVFNAIVSLYDNEAEALEPPAADNPAHAAAVASLSEPTAEATRLQILAPASGADTSGTAANPDVLAADELPAANDPDIDEVVAANDPIVDASALRAEAAVPVDVGRLDIDLGALAPAADEWQVVPQLRPAGSGPPDLTEPRAPQPNSRAVAAQPRERPVEAAPVDDLPLEELAPVAASRRAARLWAGGSAVLALLLVAQGVHQQRETLLAWPALTQPLLRFYAAIGRPIRLRGDLGAYDVRQLGAVAAADAAGTLTVRASLRNLSARPQPMPLLRVTLQDRYGNRVASRDLTAAEYQQRPAGSAPMTLLRAGERLETSVQLVDPGGNAVGFELDVCLAERGVTRCASELVAATAR